MAQLVRVTMDGKVHEIDLEEVSALDEKLFRQQVGVPFGGVVSGQVPLGLDVLAGMVWLARRKAGELTLTYDQVAEGITFRTDLDLDMEEVNRPEA